MLGPTCFRLRFPKPANFTTFTKLFRDIHESGNQDIVTNMKKIIKMARKWQRVAAIRRKRISPPPTEDHAGTSSSSSSSVADKGHFVVYTTDEKRYAFPIAYLNNHIFRELFKINQDIMTNMKKIIKMARKWQRVAAIRRKRISPPPTEDHAGTSSSSSSSVADKGHFVVYTTDEKRYAFPIAYLNNHIFRELFKMSEEEFGLPSDGPITLPCDALFMDYAVSLIKRRTPKDLEKALLMSIDSSKCSSSFSLHPQNWTPQLLVCSF
ncbi:unnamed protein product [Ilex paraguariensis]|uniref:Uncharacterized protein n=1 Tax=Ilex paraguariensis TaxID=185542 RepID=A0ABC8SH83_9AQUA